MRSIRRHLLLWLFPGFVALLAGAGAAVYLAVLRGLEAEMNRELRDLASAIPFVEGSGTAGLNLEDFADDGRGGRYFQIWGPDGVRWLKSENLGRFELKPPAKFFARGEFGEQVLGNEDAVRTLALRAAATQGLGRVNIMVARSREEMDASLFRLKIAIVSIGLLAAGGFTLLLELALRSGLRPLAKLGDQAARIDAESLGARFPANRVPGEMRPIVERLNDLIARLEQSFARERRFSADLAHELRNPVAALRSIAEVAQKWPEEATDENYEDIRTIAEELQVTIENMLLLTRLENPDSETEKKEIGIGELIDECWLAFSPRAETRGVALENRMPGEVTIETDPKLLRVIISNLLSNGAEYAPEGSRIVVEEGSEADILKVSNPAPQLTPDDLPGFSNGSGVMINRGPIPVTAASAWPWQNRAPGP